MQSDPYEDLDITMEYGPNIDISSTSNECVAQASAFATPNVPMTASDPGLVVIHYPVRSTRGKPPDKLTL